MQGLQSLIFLVLLLGVFYFLLIRPQKRRVEDHRRLIESIGVGDDIVTIGGLFGTVTSIRDDEFEIEAAPGIRLRFLKSAIARRVDEEIDEVAADTAEEEEGT